MKEFLIILNPQNDFLDTEGAMYIPNNNLIERILMHTRLNNYDGIIFAMSTYNPNHPAFIPNYGVYPIHCVDFTWGTAMPRRLEELIKDYPRHCSFAYKGDRILGLIPKIEEGFFIADSQSQNVINILMLACDCVGEEYNFHICGIDGEDILQESIKNLESFVNKENITLLPELIVTKNKDTFEACIIENGYNCLYFE